MSCVIKTVQTDELLPCLLQPQKRACWEQQPLPCLADLEYTCKLMRTHSTISLDQCVQALATLLEHKIIKQACYLSRHACTILGGIRAPYLIMFRFEIAQLRKQGSA